MKTKPIKQESDVTVKKIGHNWYRSMVTIGSTKHTFFGYSREEVAGKARRELQKAEVLNV